ncbi:MAG: hypothetical protein AB7P00_19495 [Sandaracinaceae bacterium]
MLVLALVALPLAGCEPDSPPPPGAQDGPPVRVVAVDWLGRGNLYAARATEERGEFTRVEYADGDHEWVERERLQPWPNLDGRQVQYYTGTRAVDVTVLETRDALFHVRLGDGGDTWISADMLYRLDSTATPPPPPPPPPEARGFPVRPAVEPSTIVAGRYVLAYWMDGTQVNTARPWLARVRDRSAERVHLLYLDGTEADVPADAIVRVFDEPVASPRIGERYWIADAHAVGTVLELRAGLTKVRAGEEERWLDELTVLAACPRIDASQLSEGTHVDALWSGTDLYHATVVSVAGAAVTLAWFDGSAPSEVPIDSVVEIW